MAGFELEPVLRRAVYLTGPTASGKTALGVELARRLDAEIIALDSMTLYRGMDIGTAKPTLAERQEIPHHVIDVLDVWEYGSVADYRGWALAAAREIEARGKRVLFVGGTPLYLKALFRGLFEGPSADPAIRAELAREAAHHEPGWLHAQVQAVDPVVAARLHPNDQLRLIRALEFFRLTGGPISDWQTEHARSASGLAVYALGRERAELHRRIAARIRQMFADGFLVELERLKHAPHPLHPVPAQAVGYQEGFALLEGRLSRDAAIERIETRTRQFARRQETWFRGLSEVEAWPVGLESTSELADRLAAAAAARLGG